MPDRAEPLSRELNLGQAASIVVGIVIGSGIFVGANRVAQGVDSAAAIFLIWIVAGLLTLLGALTYAEFGALYPRSGGDYVYARESLGRFAGFFNGWLTFSINYPASLAALALAWSAQLDTLKPGAHRILLFDDFSLKFTALAILFIFTVLNYLGVRQGGWAQLAITVGKIGLIFGLVLLVLLAPEGDPSNLGRAIPATHTLAVAFVGALWAYDGWTGITKVAGEVRDPQRTLPRSLGLGIIGVIALYLMLTFVYLWVLGLDGMRGTGLPDDEARAVASRAAEAVFGAPGQTFVSLLILVSILGPLNGLTLAGPRVYYAMARDRLFPLALARVHPIRRVPHISLIFQALFSGLLVVFFTFEQLSSYVVLASWTAYAITGFALIRHRRKYPDAERPYKVPGYPFVPVLFLALSTAFVLYLAVDSLLDDQLVLGVPKSFLYLLGNLFVMALAVPVYFAFTRRMDATRLPD